MFEIHPDATATFSNLTVQGGESSPAGGAFFVAADATADINEVVITDNSADRGGGIRNEGTLFVTDSTISSNESTSSSGGGISNGAFAQIDNTTIINNESDISGGGCLLYTSPSPRDRG